MNYIPLVAKILQVGFRICYPRIRTEVLSEPHREAAVNLLSRQFVEHEPLCRALGLTLADIKPSFEQQVDFAIAEGLSIAALNPLGEVVGVLTVEDQAHPFPPASCPPKLRPLLEYLDSIAVPKELQSSRIGTVFYACLAAVTRGRENKGSLPLMILALYWHTKNLGFKQGYAKITNDRIVARLRKLERFTLRQIFKPKAVARASEFRLGNVQPFASYPGSAALYSWPIL